MAKKKVKYNLDTRPIDTPTVTSYHRTKTKDGIKVDGKYYKRYYSVIDAEIYFGNEYVEDVCYIDWSVSQNTLPLFGYNSYTYDELAQGNRLITGTFDINFTSPNYLFEILKTAKEDSVTGLSNYYVNIPKDLKGQKDYKKLAGTQITGKHAPLWDHTFDIDVIYGQPHDHCVHIVLEGVAITGCQQVLSASATEGSPSIRERYSFVARDFKTVV